MNVKTTHIGEIVKNDFRTAAIFKKNGIDFCCKGNRTIEEASINKGINPELIYNEIEALATKEKSNIDFDTFPLDLLVDYIEKTHHRYAYEKIPILHAFLEKVAHVHGERHPELLEVKNLFNESIADLSNHFKKEELMLFPFIKQMVKSKLENTKLENSRFGSVENPINMMLGDHNHEGERFAKIAKLTDNYTSPEDACNTFRVTYAMLEEFENDLHTHIHLENNILFPKAIKLEKELNTIHA